MVDKKEDKQTLEPFVLKTNIPLKYAEELRDWKQNCRKAPPEGFNDGHWFKMMHDHYFVKNYKPILQELTDNINDLNDKIDMLIDAISKKEVKDANKDLFK